MVKPVHPPRSARRGFTLVELLVVIAVIAVLAGMILAVVGSMRHKARVLSTQSRMQGVVNGLSLYAQVDGSAAFALQQACALGGLGKVGSLESIATSVAAGGGSAAGRYMPPLLVKPDGTGVEWSSSNFESYQQRAYWKAVWDALPPSTGPVARDWYLEQWPSQWPPSDWDGVPAGDAPPILRFPWGRPGLALNGAICDESKPTTHVFERILEYKNIDAWRHNDTSDPAKFTRVPVPNACVATGAPAAGDRLAYATASGAETSPIVGTITGTRSDGSTVSVEANQPLPFDLGCLSPVRTIELLQAADILPLTGGDAAYRTDRAPSRTWNDAWGHPLVVAYALFIPERYQRVATGMNDRHLLWQKSVTAYDCNRSVYLAVGAIGPDRGPLAGDLAALAGSTSHAMDRAPLATLWKRIARTCDAHTWNESTFSSGPWKDVKAGKKDGMRSFLSAPLQVR